MKCAVGSSSTVIAGDTEYDTILSELGQTGGDTIDVIPKGCLPVSEDLCKSGFMAPIENITYPQDAVASCCKCREGETCDYCLDKDNCTDAEKSAYVTDNDCFAPTPPPVPIGPSPVPIGPSPVPSPEPLVESFDIMKYKWYILAFIILVIVVMFFGRSK